MLISILIFFGINIVNAENIESDHPIDLDHSSNSTYSREWMVQMPIDAELIRLHIAKWSLNEGDTVSIFDNQGARISKNGNGANGEDYWSPWLHSHDFITIKLLSKTGEAYGFSFDTIETDADQDTVLFETSGHNSESENDVFESSSSLIENSDAGNYEEDQLNDDAGLHETPESVEEPEPMTVTSTTDSSSTHKLTAAGKKMVRTHRKKMPANIQPSTPTTPSVTVTLHIQDIDAKVGQSIPVTYTVTNKITKPILHCQMFIQPPSGMCVNSIKNAEGKGGQFFSEVDIQPGESHSIELRLIPNSAGNYTIRSYALYYFGKDLTTHEENNSSVNIYATPAVPTQKSTQEVSQTDSIDWFISQIENAGQRFLSIVEEL
jgi:hypothetical protein